jgi:hypothetical protein
LPGAFVSDGLGFGAFALGFVDALEEGEKGEGLSADFVGETGEGEFVGFGDGEVDFAARK